MIMCWNPAARAEAVLGHGRGVAVVLDHHRDAEAGLEAVAQVDAGERDVHGRDCTPRCAGRSSTGSPTPSAEKPLDGEASMTRSS